MIVSSRLHDVALTDGRHLVCNALTGDVLVLSSSGRDALGQIRKDGGRSLSEAHIATLGAKGLVFSSREEEEDAFRGLCAPAWREFLSEAPRSYTFILNAHCNFSCRYCFEKAFNEPAATLSPSQIDSAFRVVDALAAKRPGRPTFEIFGGETLLPGSTESLVHLLRALEQRGARATLQTNGYYLERNIDLIAAHEKQIGQIQITLDGPGSLHDRRRTTRNGTATFDRIVKGINALRARDTPVAVNIRMNVDRENIGALDAMIAVYDENGWTSDPRFSFVAAPVDNRCGRLDADAGLVTWDELLAEVMPRSRDKKGGPFELSVFKPLNHLRHYFGAIHSARKSGEPPRTRFIPRVAYCEAAALKLFVFHPDQRIYPCPEATGMSEYAIGSYAPEFRIDFAAARQWMKPTVLQNARCRFCSISTLCGGGCALYARTRREGADACENAVNVVERYLEEFRSPPQRQRDPVR